MNTAKVITKDYFAAALTISFTHIITSAHKMGGEGYEPYAAPFLVDGFAILGMHMRNEKYDDRTNKIGLWAQCTAGLASLGMNVHAANSTFGLLLGIGVVVLFLATEWMAGNIRLRTDANADKAAAEAQAIIAAASAYLTRCNHPTTCTSEAQCISKTKAQKTKASKARKAKQQVKVLESMIG